ncbi:TIGR01244 family sulfur transferase [Komagataeibacter xylinus]|uniref:TIGR01244 family sulfur transferase n=1 Tax=Komagataeibacter xylinus TaxID=28448 RepID=UPI00280BC1DF|nr:TIGR01244 family sulfur transferase [Komagataeibacter xylinus]
MNDLARALTPMFYVAPQLTVSDINKAASDGFKSILCARPDDEQGNHVPSKEIEQAAFCLGLDFTIIPVQQGHLPDANAVTRMRAALKLMAGPVLGYCRSGTRAAQLWAMAEVGTLPDSEILEAGRKIGIDLSAAIAAAPRPNADT